MAILMFIDGVMRDPRTNAPISQGMALYRTFREKSRVLLLSEDKSRADRWLRENKLSLFDDIVGGEMTAGSEFPEFAQVKYCRGLGPVDTVITSDPDLATKLLEIGVTTLMFLQPVYITEKFRPDSRQGARAWANIKNEIIAQQEALMEDGRLQ